MKNSIKAIYNREANCLYLKLKQGKIIYSASNFNYSIIVDYNGNDKIVGIEVLGVTKLKEDGNYD